MRRVKKFTQHQVQQMGVEFDAGSSLKEISAKWQIPYRTLIEHKKRNFSRDVHTSKQDAVRSDVSIEAHQPSSTLSVPDLNVPQMLESWKYAMDAFKRFTLYVNTEACEGRFDNKNLETLIMFYALAAEAVRSIKACGYPENAEEWQSMLRNGDKMVATLQLIQNMQTRLARVAHPAPKSAEDCIKKSSFY